MKSEVLSLQGEFIVSVGDAVVLDVSEVSEAADRAPAKFATGESVYEVVYDSSTLGGVESVLITPSDIHSFIDILYMCQRSSRSDQWNSLPDSVADVYDCLVFTQYQIYAEDGRETYQKELEQLEKSDEFKTSKPKWVREALNR